MARNGVLRAKKTLVNEQSRLTRYFSKSIQKQVAENAGNIETQRDLLLYYVETNHPGMASLFNDNYYFEIDEFINFIENKNRNIVERVQDKKLGLGVVRKKKVDTKGRPSGVVLIKSKTKKGKAYVREKPSKFENKKIAVAFIKKQSETGKSNKEITEKYNLFAENRGWKLRTVSSITTLKSRSKIKK